MHGRFKVVALLMSGYFGYILSAVALPSLIPKILETNEKLTIQDFSTILAMGNFFACFGNILWGIISDYLPRKILFTACLFSLSTCLFMLQWNFKISWYVLKLFSAAGWLSLTTITMNWYDAKELPSIFSKMAINSRASNLISSFLLGFLLKFLEWPSILLLCSFLTGVLAFLNLFFLQESPTVKQKVSNAKQQEKMKNKETFLQAITGLVSSLSFWLICLSYSTIAAIIEMSSLLPMILTKKNFSASSCAVVSALSPSGSCISYLQVFHQLD